MGLSWAVGRTILAVAVLGYGAAWPVMAQSMAGAEAGLKTLRLRGGEHPGYSRLVLDWGRTVGYTVHAPVSDRFEVTFDQDARLDTGGVRLVDLSRIDGLTVESEIPLELHIDVEDGAELKGLKLGTRIVFDVIAPVKRAAGEGQSIGPVSAPPLKPLPPLESLPPLKPLPPLESLPDVSDLRVHDTAGGRALAAEKTPELQTPETGGGITLSDPVELAYDAFHWKEAPVYPPPPAIDPQMKQPNVVMLASVSAVPMAVFSDAGRLWMLTNKKRAGFSPQVVGPQAGDLGTPMAYGFEEGKVLSVKALVGAEYEVQKQGQAWSVLIAPELKPDMPSIVPELHEDGRIVWPLKTASHSIPFRHPNTQELYYAVTVHAAKDYVGEAYQFIDFDVLPAALGMIIRPKRDDVVVRVDENGVWLDSVLGRPLSLSKPSDRAASSFIGRKGRVSYYGRRPEGGTLVGQPNLGLLDFPNWVLDKRQALSALKSETLEGLVGLSSEAQRDVLLRAARAYVASGMGAEALGFLSLVRQSFPDVTRTAEYRAILGVAQAMQGQFERAVSTLADPLVKDRSEVRYWRSFVLAHLSDWQQAIDVLPSDFVALHYMPPSVSVPLVLTLAEVTLRAGDAVRSADLFSIMEDRDVQAVMRPADQSAFVYLQGEAARQAGEVENAIQLWTKLYESDDDLYRVRGGVALTRLQVETAGLKLSAAIDRLERLRYAWRGDDLEAQLNYWLGYFYTRSGAHVKGLNIMRESASYAKSRHLGQRIIADMRDIFQSLYLTDKLEELSAPQAAALFEHYAELVPAGDVGRTMARRLADHLARAHLYDRAIEILSQQLEDSKGKDADGRLGLRLAALYQLNGAPDKALDVLKELSQDALFEDVVMLKARALADTGKVKAAFSVLEAEGATPNMQRLRAELAWQDGDWHEAADALHYVMRDAEILPDNALTHEQAEIVLQRAVALNLSGDRIRLANLREVYGSAFETMDKAHAFQAVTRTHRSPDLADRKTLLSVASEIEVFSGFLQAYPFGDAAGDRGRAEVLK